MSPPTAHRDHGVTGGPLWRQTAKFSASSPEDRRSFEYSVLVGNTLTSYSDVLSYKRGDHPTSFLRIVGASAWNPSKGSDILSAETTFRLVTFQGTQVYCTAPCSQDRDLWLSALHAGLEASYSRPEEQPKKTLEPPSPEKKQSKRGWGRGDKPVVYCQCCGRVDDDSQKSVVQPSSSPLPQYGMETRTDVCSDCLVSQGFYFHIQMLCDMYASEVHERSALVEARDIALKTVRAVSPAPTRGDSHSGTSRSDDQTSGGTTGSWTQVGSDVSTTEEGEAGRNMSGSRMAVDPPAQSPEQHWINIPPAEKSTEALLHLIQSASFSSYRRICPVLDMQCRAMEAGEIGCAAEFFEALDEACGLSQRDELGELKKQALVVAGDMGTAMKLLQDHALSSSPDQQGDHHTEMLACLLEFLLDLCDDGELSAVAFFWPQLQRIHLRMLPPTNTSELARVELLEDFLLTISTKYSIHLAMELAWGYVGDLEDSMQNVNASMECKRRRFAVMRFVCELESLVFDFTDGWGGGNVSLRGMLKPSNHQDGMLRDAMKNLQQQRRSRVVSPCLSRSVRMDKLKQHSAKFTKPYEEAAQESLRITLNADYFSSHISFTRRLGEIAEKLRFMDEDKRAAALERELDLLNSSGSMGGDPLNRVLSKGLIRVVRVPRGEGHVFRSKERTPVLLLMETSLEGVEEVHLGDENIELVEEPLADKLAKATVEDKESVQRKFDNEEILPKGSDDNEGDEAADVQESDGSVDENAVSVENPPPAVPVDSKEEDEANDEDSSPENESEEESENAEDGPGGGTGDGKPEDAPESADEKEDITEGDGNPQENETAENIDVSPGEDKEADEDEEECKSEKEDAAANDETPLKSGAEEDKAREAIIDTPSGSIPGTPLQTSEHRVKQSPRHAHGTLRRFDSPGVPLTAKQSAATPDKETVEDLVANMMVNQLHVPDLEKDTPPKEGGVVGISEAKGDGDDEPKNNVTESEASERMSEPLPNAGATSSPSLSPGSSSRERISPVRSTQSRKVSAFGSISSLSVGDLGPSSPNNFFGANDDLRREVLATIMIKGMRGTNAIARGAAPAAQKNLQALDRKRAVELILDGEELEEDEAGDNDEKNKLESTRSKLALSLGVDSSDEIAHELGIVQPSEEDEAMESLRLLLIQNRVAQGTISAESAALALAPIRGSSLNQVNPKFGDLGGVDDSDAPQIDAGDVDHRLAGCGPLPPAVLSALILYKGDMCSPDELIEIVKKDIQHSATTSSTSKLIEDSAFWGRFAFGERWVEKKARIAASSPKGTVSCWDLVGVIVKSNDDLRQEAFVMQLIDLCQEAFDLAGLDELWLHPYRILSSGRTTGIIEMVRNAMSFDALKKRPGYQGGLRGHLKKMCEFDTDPDESFRSMQRNFVRSLASYSVLSHLFLFKDRHNGNMLLDTAGHVIHIDFGFVFGIAPGGSFSLELSTPFKLTDDMIDVMGGLSSPLFSEFVTLFCCGFLALRAHANTFLTIVEITCQGSSFKCFDGRDPKEIVGGLRDRFKLDLDREECVMFCLDLIHQAISSYGTKQYDYFQYLSQGIAT